MIEVSHVHKRFGAVVAVEDVSFRALDGKITGLLGPNGAGKTTTLRMIGALLPPDRGHTTVDGVDAVKSPVEVRRKLGILPDARGLYPRLTAREHMRYFGRLHDLGGRALEARIDALLDTLDMRPLADRRVEGFSAGERLKVAIARMLVHDPANLLLDEPTSGLDVVATRSLRELVRRLRDQGRCVILSTHVMQEVAALCDEIVIVAGGKVAASGTAASLLEQTGQSSIEDAFVAALGTREGVTP